MPVAPFDSDLLTTSATMSDILGAFTRVTGGSYSYVFYSVDEDMVSDGFFIDEAGTSWGTADLEAFFSRTSNESVVDYLEDGDMTILWELFWNNDEAETQTQTYSAASNTSNPTLTEVTEALDLTSGPLAGFRSGPGSALSYDSDESTRLSERFGSIYTVAEIIETELTSMANNLLNSSVRVEYNFKKIRRAPLSEDDLTAFETEEAASTLTVGTTMAATDLTTTTVPEGY